jgi:oligo-1,6-glucosidase
MHTTLWGTVYIHQGQEIGMINLPKEWPLDEWKDCKTQNVAKKYAIMRSGLTSRIIDKGVDVDEQLKKVYHKARDNGRSPMQVSSSVGCYRKANLTG